jgi:hypothetical protein
MIGRASGLGMVVGRFSRPVKGVGAIAMPNAGVDVTRRVAVTPGAGVLRILVTGVAVGVFIDHRCVADGVEVTR